MPGPGRLRRGRAAGRGRPRQASGAAQRARADPPAGDAGRPRHRHGPADPRPGDQPDARVDGGDAGLPHQPHARGGLAGHRPGQVPLGRAGPRVRPRGRGPRLPQDHPPVCLTDDARRGVRPRGRAPRRRPGTRSLNVSVHGRMLDGI
ncbi:hypothetical protein MICRO116_250026 [Micrococcus sp. 116]|nr:hypothetical protein MICRO116_250026 [Micrococcus sp. 116]